MMCFLMALDRIAAERGEGLRPELRGPLHVANPCGKTNRLIKSQTTVNLIGHCGNVGHQPSNPRDGL